MLPSEYLEKGWCRLAGAKKEEGEKVAVTNFKAVSWDIAGAVLASEADRTIDEGIASLFMEFLSSRLDDGINAWNDKQDSVDSVLVVMRLAERELLGVKACLHTLTVKRDGDENYVCSKCGARKDVDY